MNATTDTPRSDAIEFVRDADGSIVGAGYCGMLFEAPSIERAREELRGKGLPGNHAGAVKLLAMRRAGLIRGEEPDPVEHPHVMVVSDDGETRFTASGVENIEVRRVDAQSYEFRISTTRGEIGALMPTWVALSVWSALEEIVGSEQGKADIAALAAEYRAGAGPVGIGELELREISGVGYTITRRPGETDEEMKERARVASEEADARLGLN